MIMGKLAARSVSEKFEDGSLSTLTGLGQVRVGYDIGEKWNIGAVTRSNVLIHKAFALLDLGAIDEAEALFKEARRVNPTSLAAAYRVELGLGNTSFSRGECTTALQHFEQAHIDGAECAGEDHLLRLSQGLVAEDEDGILIHGGFDLGGQGRVGGSLQINPSGFGGKQRM